MNHQKEVIKNHKENHKKNCLGKNMPFFVPIFLILFIAGFFIGILWVEKIRSDRVYLRGGNIYEYETPQRINEIPKSQNGGDGLAGGDRDSHGCIGSAGYSWCEEKQKCLRSWEEECDICGKEGDLIGEKIDECCEGLEPVPLSSSGFGGLFECRKK